MDASRPGPGPSEGPRGFLRNKGLIWILGAVLAASLLIWIPLVGRFSLDDPQPIPVHPARINQDPQPFLGRKVQVEGEVERIYGPRAFALDEVQGEGARGTGASGLLVVGRKPWSLLQKDPQVNELLRNDHVQVTGRVRKFRLREFQDESGGHPSDSLLARWEGRPALVALDIELTPGVPDLFPAGPQRRGVGGADGTGPGAGSASAADTTGPMSDTAFGQPR